MTVSEMYAVAKEIGYKAFVIMVEFLVNEKGVVGWGDNAETLTYYMHPRFKKKMNEYLVEYERRNYEGYD